MMTQLTKLNAITADLCKDGDWLDKVLRKILKEYTFKTPIAYKIPTSEYYGGHCIQISFSYNHTCLICNGSTLNPLNIPVLERSSLLSNWEKYSKEFYKEAKKHSDLITKRIANLPFNSRTDDS